MQVPPPHKLKYDTAWAELEPGEFVVMEGTNTMVWVVVKRDEKGLDLVSVAHPPGDRYQMRPSAPVARVQLYGRVSQEG